MPNFATGIPNLLLFDAMRMSVAIESSQPPPTQIPRIIEIVGTDNASIASRAPSKAFEYILAVSESFLCVSKSLISAPAENDFSPSPKNTADRIDESSSILLAISINFNQPS